MPLPIWVSLLDVHKLTMHLSAEGVHSLWPKIKKVLSLIFRLVVSQKAQESTHLAEGHTPPCAFPHLKWQRKFYSWFGEQEWAAVSSQNILCPTLFQSALACMREQPCQLLIGSQGRQTGNPNPTTTRIESASSLSIWSLKSCAQTKCRAARFKRAQHSARRSLWDFPVLRP